MKNWLNRYHRLNDLEKRLRAVAEQSVRLSKTKRESIRSRVLNRIEESLARETVGFDQLAEQLEKLTLEVAPTSKFRVHARQSLLDQLSFKLHRLGVVELLRDVFLQRRVWATVVAGLVLFVGTFGYMYQLPQVEAAKASTVESVRGGVFVSRDGVTSEVENGFLVEEGDVLSTLGDGWMDILLVDDSYVTLGPNTEVSVVQLWSNPDNEANTAIELELIQGRIWANVVNLMSNDSSFELVAEDATFSVDRKAVFDVVVTENAIRTRVFSQLVDFSVVQGGIERSGTVGKDLQLQLTDDEFIVEPIEDLDRLVGEDVWVQTNLEGEQTYLDHLNNYYRERLNQTAGTLPGEMLYPLKLAGENMRLLFTLNDESKSDVNVDLAEIRFSEAVALIELGEWESAESALDAYQALVVEVAAGDGEAAQALIEETKKIIDGGLSAAESYDLRAIVEEVEVLVAPDDSALGVVQLETAADRLGLALELIDIGAYDLALKSLQDYEQGYTNVLAGLVDLDVENRRELVLAVLDQKLRDLQMLKLIVAEVELSEEMQAQLASLQGSVLFELNSLVLSLKDRAVLHLGTFLEDVKGDEEIQQQVLNRLKKEVDLDFEFIQKINDIEAMMKDENPAVVRVEEKFITPQSQQVQK